jgi:hypothetical protein
LIAYRKTPGLRTVRFTVPQPPFWCATAIAPYSGRSDVPVSIDYLAAQARQADRPDVNVCQSVEDEIERLEEKSPLTAPILIDASGSAEVTYRRGEAALRCCRGAGLDSLILISTCGAVPDLVADEGTGLVISVWPFDLQRLAALFDEATRSGAAWGVLVPVIYPVTTELGALRRLASLAGRAGARFMAAFSVELDPPAKHAVVSALPATESDDAYAALFHSDLETLHAATERHVAALAHEKGMGDFVPPYRAPQCTNWNAATLLSRAGTRMISMKSEAELGWTVLRSARFVAELPKPIDRVAEAASLSIVPAIDPVSAQALEQWLATGRSDFCDGVDKAWRLRRDHLA